MNAITARHFGVLLFQKLIKMVNLEDKYAHFPSEMRNVCPDPLKRF